ncbi:MAG TPA: hypothetical protein VFV44_00415 [Nitrospiraceae bacterium]|nr:hypothetical protein [Nitrospiraceae bacterium]
MAQHRPTSREAERPVAWPDSTVDRTGKPIDQQEPLCRTPFARMKQFSLRDLPQRSGWLHLYTAPDRIRDNVRAIEDYLAEAETLVKDGCGLHRMLEEKSMQPVSAQVEA